MPTRNHTLPTPSAADSSLARESSRQLAKLLAAKHAPTRFQIAAENTPEEAISLPLPALRMLATILTELGKGNGVRLLPIQAELTTQEAADLLDVSRPFLIDLLEKGTIPFRKVGTHRRVLLQDVLAYKDTTDQDRLQALEELSALDQELGFGY